MNKISFDNFFPTNVISFVGDKSKDFKQTPEKKDLTTEQKEFLNHELEFNLPDVVNISQVHGKRNIVVNQQNRHLIEEADGLLTQETDIPLVIRTADCLSIFIYDPVQQAIGLIHAGWKSTKLLIAQQAVSDMIEAFGSNPKDLKIAFGPCIRNESGEVGPEFKEYFPDETFEKNGKLYFDLPLANRHQLKKSGVQESNISDCEIDTVTHPEYFSYRTQGDEAGRMILLMMLRS